MVKPFSLLYTFLYSTPSLVAVPEPPELPAVASRPSHHFAVLLSSSVDGVEFLLLLLFSEDVSEDDLSSSFLSVFLSPLIVLLTLSLTFFSNCARDECVRHNNAAHISSSGLG